MLDRIPLALVIAGAWTLIWMGPLGLMWSAVTAIILVVGMLACERMGWERR